MSDEEMESESERVLIATYHSREEAEIAAATLEAEGIMCVLTEEIDPFPALRPVRLGVAMGDAAAAVVILGEAGDAAVNAAEWIAETAPTVAPEESTFEQDILPHDEEHWERYVRSPMGIFLAVLIGVVLSAALWFLFFGSMEHSAAANFWMREWKNRGSTAPQQWKHSGQ